MAIDGKMVAASSAVGLVEPGMVVGVGSGSTVNVFLDMLIKRVDEEGLQVSCVCGSSSSEKMINGRISNFG